MIWYPWAEIKRLTNELAEARDKAAMLQRRLTESLHRELAAIHLTPTPPPSRYYVGRVEMQGPTASMRWNAGGPCQGDRVVIRSLRVISGRWMGDTVLHIGTHAIDLDGVGLVSLDFSPPITFKLIDGGSPPPVYWSHYSATTHVTFFVVAEIIPA